ncbi:MAG: bifunctional UDP-N-acetylglucosamine diphosphorylase/glucosamine-1-phosphate N-acetyltransferase GlmU [Actinomycetales bacterium]|nr:bifunctional UDP-N-acetylglucosamine diphosphorylase/glucosamine-1-phosphate N-acetyltransferase GlmU [Actinomycetales bacterium]
MSEQHLAVVVLAAGAGTRMKSNKPKVMHEIAGLPLLGHALATASSLGASYVVPVIRHQKEVIAPYIEAFYPNAKIAEQDEIPGTGRAVECALAAIPEDFKGAVVVTSGDVPLLDVSTLEGLIDAHLSQGVAATILTAILDDPSGYGRVMRTSDGSFLKIVEDRDASKKQLEIREVNAGVYVFDADHLRTALGRIGLHNAQGEKYLTDVAAELLAEGFDVQGIPVTDNWLVAGINDRVQLGEVAAELNRRICEAWQKAGVTIQDPSATWIDVTVQLGQDVTLLPGTYLRGMTVVGEGANVGPEVVLVDTEVGAGASVIKAHATGSRIGDGASVGPYSYLRPGTDLGADGKIGTFVETKNAKIGAGSKVPHLSYVGDAEIGVESNIGAGTIFANYDGVKKHRSKIGSHVRTGSHNVFVAPIEIADGAYTAAGTVVRRDVAAGDLAMNVAPQRNIADWVIQKRPGSAAAQAAESAKQNSNDN